MTEWFYPTAFSSWGEEEKAAIARVLESNRFTMGSEVEAFESEFAEYHGMKHAIMVNSGSSANLIAVAALFHLKENPLKRGDKAVVPALAWSTTYAPLIQHGLDLTLIDADDTWNAADDKNLSRNVLTSKLIVGCSILGNPGYLEKWRAMARGLGAFYIEDNCESLGAWTGPYGKRKFCGTLGLMNTFSFFYSHQLSAVEGGMILTNDDECAHLCRLLRNHGNAGFVTKTTDFDESYDFQVFGYNVRPVEMHAAIAREQLKKLEGFRRQREQNRNNFELLTGGLPIRMQRRVPVPSPFGMAFIVENKTQRAKLVTAFRANGIDCRLPTGGSFRCHKYGEQWANSITPVTDHIHSCGLFLGNAPVALDAEIEFAVKVMRDTL